MLHCLYVSSKGKQTIKAETSVFNFRSEKNRSRNFCSKLHYGMGGGGGGGFTVLLFSVFLVCEIFAYKLLLYLCCQNGRSN